MILFNFFEFYYLKNDMSTVFVYSLKLILALLQSPKLQIFMLWRKKSPLKQQLLFLFQRKLSLIKNLPLSSQLLFDAKYLHLLHHQNSNAINGITGLTLEVAEAQSDSIMRSVFKSSAYVTKFDFADMIKENIENTKLKQYWRSWMYLQKKQAKTTYQQCSH